MSTSFLRRTVLCALGLIAVAPVTPAVTFNLNCVLSGSACAPFANSFGTVSITDISGGVSVVVDTAQNGKYKDLFLNFNVAPATITSPAIYSSNFFTLAPYNGKFDVGTDLSPSKGFDGLDNVAFQILGTGFNAASFIALDSFGLVNVAIHLQEIDCTSTACVPGSGSIKVGGVYTPPGDDDPGVPEPATIAIAGFGLAVIVALKRRG